MINLKLKKVYQKIFSGYASHLKKELKGCKSVLDVGCGSSSPLGEFSKNVYSVGIDAFKPNIEESKKARIHNEYKLIKALEIGDHFKKNSFDCVVALDVVEHLTKSEGIRLLRMMEKIAIKKVIVFTPNGFLAQGEYKNNPYQVHKSGWNVSEMRKKGYRVIGINGWKALRGEYAQITFKPRFFWRIISDISQIFVNNNPEKAFQILCVKDVQELS